jgi:hypothetical protein
MWIIKFHDGIPGTLKTGRGLLKPADEAPVLQIAVLSSHFLVKVLCP